MLLEHRNHGGHKTLDTNNLWWTTAMNNITQALPVDRPLTGPVDDLRKKMLMMPEQRLVERMIELVFKFCKAKELALHACAATSATAKAGLQL